VSDILLSISDRVGLITLNRPEKLNAFAGRMREELAETFREVADDGEIRVVVLTGAGRAFCAGADIGYMRELIEREDWSAAKALVDVGATVVSLIAAMDKPVLAAVNGPAAGGGANLALACDLRIAAASASIGQTFNNIGLHPDWGGTYFLPRLIGTGRALELVLSGDMIDSTEALRIGLFNRVVDDDAVMDATLALADRLTLKPPLAVAAAKRSIRHSHQGSLQDALQVEIEQQLRLFKSTDAREGVAAFLEKRTPVYRGK
jgi:2-(1,2-epoxy-1,2-dihydrophenyl)acetyl-CoA isomerase